jgi:hypothetical protein
MSQGAQNQPDPAIVAAIDQAQDQDREPGIPLPYWVKKDEIGIEIQADDRWFYLPDREAQRLRDVLILIYGDWPT